MTFYIALSLSAFLLALLGTRLTILAQRKRLFFIRAPGLRNVPAPPMPRNGGIPLVISLIICLMVADIDYSVVISTLMLAAVSLLDDLIRVPRLIRLLVQVFAVSIPLSTLDVLVWGGLLPPWLDVGVTGFLWVLFINLFASLDGQEGLVASEMTAIGGGLALLTVFSGDFPNALSIDGLVLAAAGGGFLWWNWPPAKITLNHAGSVPIGFLVGYLLLQAGLAGYVFAISILPAYCLSDGSITLVSDMLRQRKFRLPKNGYYYQKAQHHMRHAEGPVRLIFGINLLLILLAVSSSLNPHIGSFYLATAYLCVFMLLGFFAHTAPES